MRAIARGDFREEMRGVSVPTLIVHGAKDRSVCWKGPRGPPVAGLIPGAVLNICEEGPHGLVISHRERPARDIMAFARG